MAQDVRRAVQALDFEIAMVRREPAIEDVRDIDGALAQEETPGRLLAFVPRITFDAYPLIRVVHD